MLLSASELWQHSPVQLWRHGRANRTPLGLRKNSTRTCAVVAFLSGQQDPIRTQLPTGAQSHSVDSQYLTCGSVASCPRQAPTGLHAQSVVYKTSLAELWHHVRAKRQQDLMRSQLCTKPHLQSCGIMSVPSANRTPLVTSCVQLCGPADAQICGFPGMHNLWAPLGAQIYGFP